MIAGFTGPVSALTQESADGARLCFEAVNAQGGVRGQQLELVALDDKYDAALTAQHGKNLAAQGVLAFMLPRTAQSEALVPIATQARMALIAPVSGAMSLRYPVQPNVFQPARQLPAGGRARRAPSGADRRQAHHHHQEQ